MSDQKTRMIRKSGALDRDVWLNDTHETDERVASDAGAEFGIDFAYCRQSR